MSNTMPDYNINMNRFDMSSIDDDSTVVIIGKRNTGKSFLTMDFMYHHQNIPVGTVISPTEDYNKFYGGIVPKVFIHAEPTSDVLRNVIKRQRRAVLKSHKNLESDARAFIIMDDCMAYSKEWVRDKATKIIFMNGRHLKLLTLLTLQDSLGITPDLRTNTDYVFILRDPRVNMRKRLFEHYTGGMFPTFDIFCKVMDNCTEDYECLVINNKSRSSKLEDQVFWYKAEEHEPFKIGAPQIWKYCEEHCIDEEEVDEAEEDDNNLRFYQPKKGPSLTVNKVSPNRPRPSPPYDSARRRRPESERSRAVQHESSPRSINYRSEGRIGHAPRHNRHY